MTISVIIPAFNEERTIENVIKAVQQVDAIDEILVVSDGSTDNTAEIASKMGVLVINLEANIGKGGAMKAGLQNSSGDIVLFLDADLIGLKKEHIMNLIEPVLLDKADMTVGIFEKGRFKTDLAQKISPFLSGQRAVKKEILYSIPNMDITRYGVEAALTRYASLKNIRVKTVKLCNVTHCTKEEKLGFIKGFAARMNMYIDIIKYLLNWDRRFFYVKKPKRNS